MSVSYEGSTARWVVLDNEVPDLRLAEASSGLGRETLRHLEILALADVPNSGPCFWKCIARLPLLKPFQRTAQLALL